ncbi:MAG: tetratricopeptide repeat protein [Bacteroidota bacterium]|nr:tetratricopeptide repeat protein [Bacteroidota bacterium]
MKKIGIVSSLILMGNILFAQSIDEGKKFLYYEKFESAQKNFQQMLTKDPNNVDAAYWLGQVYLQNSDNRDTAAAKTLYQQTLQAHPNAAILIVGMGEIELMEGKTDDARNRFEAAINMTRKRDLADILLAVGIANVDAKAGDPVYAVDKLQQAAERDKKSAEIQDVMGDAYRKMIDGANATLAYQRALDLDPKDARASFMIGRIYETQGYGQEAIYMRYYNDAIAEDPNFAPVYYWLYTYYYQRDVNKAREYLNKYVAVADQDSKNCYAEASLLYVSKLYDEAISKANGCIATAGARPFPNLFGLKAYAYDKKGDSLNAKKSFEEFFAKVNPDKIGPNDYATYGKVLLKFPGMDSLANVYVDKAVALDTVPSKKIGYVKDIAKDFYDKGKFAQAGEWYGKVLKVDSNFGKVDLFYAGYSDLRAENYKTADSVFKIYQQKYPSDLYGWFLGAHAKQGIDTNDSLGLAKGDYEKIIEIADTTADKASIKDKLIPAYRYMLAYHYNIMHDKDSAILFNDKILAVDPTDATALKTKEALEPATPTAPAASPAKKQ